MSEPSGESTDYRGVLSNRIKETQIDELVQNLAMILREQDTGVYSRFMEHIQNWLDMNLNFDSLDKKDAFFQGFYVGGRFVQKLYNKE